jgi:acid phosphatase family membrane protein YuiD
MAEIAMKDIFNRRQFLQAGAVATASLALSNHLFAADKKSVLVFTKSSGFEHDVVKNTGGKPSIVENAVTMLKKSTAST